MAVCSRPARPTGPNRPGSGRRAVSRPVAARAIGGLAVHPALFDLVISPTLGLCIGRWQMLSECFPISLANVTPLAECRRRKCNGDNPGWGPQGSTGNRGVPPEGGTREAGENPARARRCKRGRTPTTRSLVPSGAGKTWESRPIRKSENLAPGHRDDPLRSQEEVRSFEQAHPLPLLHGKRLFAGGAAACSVVGTPSAPSKATQQPFRPRTQAEPNQRKLQCCHPIASRRQHAAHSVF